MYHFNLQADTAAFGRYTHALITQYKNRRRCFEQGYSAEQCERVDHKLGWLLQCFSLSPVSIAQAIKLTGSVNIKRPEQLFSYLCIALQTETEALVIDVVNTYLTHNHFSNSDMNTAIVDAFVFCNAYKHRNLWNAFFQNIDKNLAMELKQQVALYVNESDRREWLPLKNDLLSQLQLRRSGQIEDSNLQQKTLANGINETQLFSLNWASKLPSSTDWAELQALELDQPENVFQIYALWGGSDALLRIVYALQHPRLNLAAYKAWLFLTQLPLPLTPMLQDRKTGQTVGDVEYACAKTAKEALDSITWFKQTQPLQRECQINLLFNALFLSVSQHDNAIWLALLTRLNCNEGQQLLQSLLFAERQTMLLHVKNQLASSSSYEH
ncbi:hypothetical protein [Reinekea sp.]|jgi:hypothetical protein|uniref:hypothetical protein n=1 Tax=Reinekea sp. TaxID=1970455 RepID=UPI003989BC91